MKGENVSTDRELPPLPEPDIVHFELGTPLGHSREQLLAYRALIAEDCAKLCEEMMDESYSEAELGGEMADPLDCAAAIRARYKAE